MNRRQRSLLVVAAGLAALSSCDSDEAAAAELTKQGFSDVELVAKDGGSWSFTATKEGTDCQGSVTVKSSGCSTTTQVSSECSFTEPATTTPTTP